MAVREQQPTGPIDREKQLPVVGIIVAVGDKCVKVHGAVLIGRSFARRDSVQGVAARPTGSIVSALASKSTRRANSSARSRNLSRDSAIRCFTRKIVSEKFSAA